MKNIKMHDTKNKRWRYAHSKKKKKVNPTAGPLQQ